MKILMICEFFNENLEYQENLLVKYYRKHGFDVTVITSTLDSVFDYYADKHDISKPTRIYEFLGAKIIKLRYKRILMKNRLRWYDNIVPILEEEAPDLIYVHDIMLNIHEATSYMHNHPGCKMIMDYHADYSNSGRSWLSLNILHGVIRRYFYLKPSLRYISKIFPIVPAGFLFLNEIYKIPYECMELLPLGADTDAADEARLSDARQKVRDALGLSYDAFVVFTGGKLNVVKQTHLLLEAIVGLKQSDIHVIIAGEADSENYKVNLQRIAAGSSNIHFLGWKNNQEIYHCLAAADIAVFPASQSILWQQAISMHLPLIVGDTGGQSVEYLNLYDNIITLKKESITSESIALEIMKLYKDKNLCRTMQVGAGKVKDKMLNWNNLIYKTLQFNK